MSVFRCTSAKLLSFCELTVLCFHFGENFFKTSDFWSTCEPRKNTQKSRNQTVNQKSFTFIYRTALFFSSKSCPVNGSNDLCALVFAETSLLPDFCHVRDASNLSERRLCFRAPSFIPILTPVGLHRDGKTNGSKD